MWMWEEHGKFRLVGKKSRGIKFFVSISEFESFLQRKSAQVRDNRVFITFQRHRLDGVHMHFHTESVSGLGPVALYSGSQKEMIIVVIHSDCLLYVIQLIFLKPLLN